VEGPDVVAIRLPPRALAERVAQVWESGAVALPLDPGATADETRRVLAATRPAAFVTDSGVEALPDAVPASAGAALVVVTSGTSGDPKPVELSHDALDASARASLARLGAGDGDRWLACLPMHHVAGLAIVVRSRVLGAEPVIHDRFDVDVFERERGVTLTSLVPTQLARLLDAGADLARFKAVLLGGSFAPPALLRRARSAGAPVVTTYGMTETCGGCVYDGRPLDGVRAEIGDEGEVMIAGPVLMNGYRLQPDATGAVLRGGWFHTADAGQIADDGTLRVLGRLDDMIVTGGKKVSPSEVEAALHEHPLVTDAAVASKPDPEWGERVVAFVVASAEEADLLDFLRARLSGFKIPRELVFLQEIPRNANGKVNRAKLPLG
jgi:O-succinylbenzoic acid--CoA ligase